MLAVILAGGFGTRLQSVVSEVPKPMAPVNDKPFLFYLLSYLKKNGFSKIVFSLYYKAEIIQNYFGSEFEGMKLYYVIDEKPLGTGGAIRNVQKQLNLNEPCVVLNGDTFFKINYQAFYEQHQQSGAQFSIAAKSLPDCSRYGRIILENQQFKQFINDGATCAGYINAGIYLFDFKLLEQISFSEVFSFEKDFLYEYTAKLNTHVYIEDAYFIDIGVPDDYKKFNEDVKLLHW